MVTVEIAGNKRPLEETSERWITQQINRRRKDGVSVCVRVIIQDENVDMVLVSAGCTRGRSARHWTPNRRERRLLNLRRDCGLSKPDFTGGHLVRFLKRLRI